MMAGTEDFSGFDASSVVKPLKYSFKPWASSAGTIKEPSDEQIGKFLDDIKAFYNTVSAEQAGIEKVSGSTDPDEVLAALNNLDLGGMIGKISQMSEAYSRLCSGKPTAEEIQALPLRIRAHFFAWIQSEVVSPEAGPGAGNAQVVTLRTERAG